MEENNNFDELIDFISLNNSNNEMKKSKKKNVKLFFINILAITLLVSSGIGIKTYFDQKKDAEEIIRLKEELKKDVLVKEDVILTPSTKEENDEVIEDEEEEVVLKPDYSILVKENDDMVGWLTVIGTDIDMPIVQSDDNEFYMNHDFNKKWNVMGWAFADYRNSFPELSRNTILYGHTYKDTIIFSSLKNVLNKKWLNNKENQYITFNTLEEVMTWEVFSVYTIDKTNDYLSVNFDDNLFDKYIRMVKHRSIKDFDVDVSVSDKIITLSTCYIDSDTRLVVHAKLVN